MNRDLASCTDVAVTLTPADRSGATNGTGIDLQDAGSCFLHINTGVNTGTFIGTVKLQDSDDNTTFADSTSVAITGADTGYKVAYTGNKRYVRARLEKTSGTSIFVGAVFAKGHLSIAPSDASYAS